MNSRLKKNILCTTLLVMLVLSSCSTTNNSAESTINVAQQKNKYKYLHKCTIQGKEVEHTISAAVPLTLHELALLKNTVEDKFGLDRQSCIYLGK